MILLDTCTLLWLSDPDTDLPDAVLRALRSSPPSERFVSAISAFEIGYKHALGKLKLPLKPALWFRENCAQRGLTCLPLTESIALRAAQLPRHHRDPGDRFIVSTAMEYDLLVLTPDQHFAPYPVKVLWS